MNLTLSELDAGSWVIFELPGFTTAAAGSAVDSLDALRQADLRISDLVTAEADLEELFLQVTSGDREPEVAA